jgi:hypothetical protein
MLTILLGIAAITRVERINLVVTKQKGKARPVFPTVTLPYAQLGPFHAFDQDNGEHTPCPHRFLRQWAC